MKKNNKSLLLLLIGLMGLSINGCKDNNNSNTNVKYENLKIDIDRNNLVKEEVSEYKNKLSDFM